MTFKYNVGDRVILNTPERDINGHDFITGLYIPDFFYLMNGKEFVISKQNDFSIYPRYSFYGKFYVDDYCEHLEEYVFDEHWLSPAEEDLVIESEVEFF